MQIKPHCPWVSFIRAETKSCQIKKEQEWTLGHKVFASNFRHLSEINLSKNKNWQESSFPPWKDLSASLVGFLFF